MKRNRCLYFVLLSSVFLSACSGKGASHIPSPLELPGAIIGTTIENFSYNVKRREIADYVFSNYQNLRNDAKKAAGPTLKQALDIVNIKGNKRNRVTADLQKNQGLYFYSADKVASVLVNHYAGLYQVRREDKKINGFTYHAVYQTIKNHAQNDFEALRLAIKQGDGNALIELIRKLNILEPKKQTEFLEKSSSSYSSIYIEPVVVVLMVHR